jgi:Na+-driven multidrug efflux pump
LAIRWRTRPADGFNLGSGACLRGAGDVQLPAVMVLALSWLLFVPSAHGLSFASGMGWWAMESV